ncbi:glutamate synthase [Ktedonobacter sp. SOSP1-52]|uniref:glutamate synthase large subunit n=1 Tax=Ktedonobacter sp. SOSP1-52 TaxID=2778366 RepID=UPI001916B1F6|nr:glutamate synthase large subunit [Ktedonobacter sp. SOSP1-52]GHO66710.1 glutamate synthase [Ktedonobacter sp. SOSP1-52]
MQHKHTAQHMTYPLYDPRWEHDACGTGFLARLSGEADHALVQTALTALTHLTHRGAQDADAETSDGAGILTQIPLPLFYAELERQHISPSSVQDLAVGMLFLPQQERAPQAYEHSRQIIMQTLQEVGIPALTWRTPPINYAILGARARASAPTISQVIISRPEQLDLEAYDRALYHARRLIEQHLAQAKLEDCYIASLSRNTIIYKGLLAPNQLASFYLDLVDPDYVSALAVFHQRYSTNTLPSWPLAQPFRLLAHNGEINTIQGNRNWMQAREKALASPLWQEKIADLLPVIPATGSDSAQLDNALELLTHSGRDLLHSAQMLVPPAWEQDTEFDEAQRAWCEYHAGLVEPWDGPAALVFSDGRIVGAALDRNGLRPARYTLTRDGLLIVASEAGVVPCDPENIAEKGGLGPGEIIAADLVAHKVLHNAEVKSDLAQRQPYHQWLEDHLLHLTELEATSSDEVVRDPETLFTHQQLFGYTHEDVEMVLRPILAENKEPTWSMGDDAPLAALSTISRTFSDYFRQRFAQVTNPPIDPLRERIVMSLDSYLGPRQSLLTETPEHARLVRLTSPILDKKQLSILRDTTQSHLRPATLKTTLDIIHPDNTVEMALDRLEQEALAAIENGATLLVLSDQDATLEQPPLPMLIAVGAVHHALIKHGLRARVSLICETGTVCDVHQIAVLLGYGAEAVVPTLALASVRALAGERRLEHITPEEAVARYRHVIEDGLCKIMARMGISTLRNIIGAGQFEILGLSPELVERCFTDSAARYGKVSFAQVNEEIRKQVAKIQEEQQAPATGPAVRKRKLADMGRFRFRRDAEYHAYNPLIIRALQKAAQTGLTEDYRQYTGMVYQRPATNLRDQLRFTTRQPIPLAEVESMESIRARFVVSAMSVGALSPETHRTIAAAMNSIGGRNNTGEGGEDPAWYHETLEGYPVSSKIKQVASARFGITTEYLVRAEEIEIKMAQGSKPGEGGQLPPAKVTPFIARLRHTEPGVSLISPPPHHDIYSIEDIAQLIYDLHQVNPTAKVGVKLVSCLGVGTIAAGVAKGHADYVLISGNDGGTGASPLQSIKHAGMPWELGLSEAQQVLVRNGLRKRIKVRVDGGFKTGRDVIIGALLGAEEFGFGTAALVTLGCDMARQCHLNTCPAGIATQREDLKAKFTGRPQFLVNYLTLVAEEVREFMAQLGIARFEDLIGHTELLESAPDAAIDLTSLLVSLPVRSKPGRHTHDAPARVEQELLTEVESALDGERSILTQHPIANYDRSVGTVLAGEIARRYGNEGLTRNSITCTFHGAAGQSFGAFCMPGMRLILNGEANDYVGKSMTGGQIVILPPAEAAYEGHKNTILGNTVLYGATGGQLFAAGRAGERFAVRNSGALAVVEGVGAHACEYMTGGMVVVLGETGPNFAAGMSSGVAYVLDMDGSFPTRCNLAAAQLARVQDPQESDALRTVIDWHARKTHSSHAQRLLEQWEFVLPRIWRVQPENTHQNASHFVGGREEMQNRIATK